jgi:uncharacterized protein (DUF885 family)
MRSVMRWGARLLALGLLAVVGLAVHSWYFRPLSARIFYERVFIQTAVDSPEMISSMRLLPGWLDWTTDELDDYSLAAGDRGVRQLEDALATLRGYDRDVLRDPLSYDVLEYFLATQVEGTRYRYHSAPLNQLFGIQSNLPTFLATQHPVADAGDAEDYLARLGEFPRISDEVMQGLRHRESLGLRPQTFVVEKVLEEMRGFTGQAPTENILYTALATQLEAAGDAIPEDRRSAILARAEAAIRDQVYPAYAQWIAWYEELLPRTTGNDGVWAMPDGEAYYAWAVRMHTSTDMTPQQVHALGLAEVARIEAEMDAILVGEGLVEGTIGDRVLQIAARADQLYPDTDAGRAQILADYQAHIDTIDAGLGPYFNVRPQQPVRVERIPEFKQAGSPGAYYQSPSFDGTRPGIFYANLRSVAEIPRFSMRTLAYHEGIPGHHFQVTIQQELQGVPTFRKLLPFTAYQEGWALYSERLASELGFQPTPLDELGRLQAEMFRAVRLVVDTGLHQERWTREQAIAYMIEKTGMPPTDVTAEIERYLVMPGQALAYKVGMNTILDLREEARAALGERFDLAAFHDEVLTKGALPMAILQREVRAWIAARQSAPATATAAAPAAPARG